MYYPISTYDAYGAQQLPKEPKAQHVAVDIYDEKIYPGDNVIKFDNGDLIQVGDFREYIDSLPDSDLIEMVNAKEVKA